MKNWQILSIKNKKSLNKERIKPNKQMRKLRYKIKIQTFNQKDQVRN